MKWTCHGAMPSSKRLLVRSSVARVSAGHFLEICRLGRAIVSLRDSQDDADNIYLAASTYINELVTIDSKSWFI